MIQIDKHYYYKGNEYVVTGFCKVKTTSGEWVDGVSYKKASEESTEIYVRDKEAFEYYFIPTTLEVGDIIIAISMGKIVAEYEVTSIDSESSQATAKSPSGIDLIVNTAVDSDAVVTKVEGGVPYQADYYYQLADMKKRMTNSTIIDKMVSELSNAATRVQDIPVSYPTFNLQESLKSIHQTLDAIYNRYGV
nr:MAG TPA: hypothetical protein [Caudoviricetes sp.]